MWHQLAKLDGRHWLRFEVHDSFNDQSRDTCWSRLLCDIKGVTVLPTENKELTSSVTGVTPVSQIRSKGIGQPLGAKPFSRLPISGSWHCVRCDTDWPNAKFLTHRSVVSSVLAVLVRSVTGSLDASNVIFPTYYYHRLYGCTWPAKNKIIGTKLKKALTIFLTCVFIRVFCWFANVASRGFQKER